MFEFFKDSLAEMQGLDSNAIKKDRLQKEIDKKEQRLFLSSSTKNIIRIIAVLYFFIGIFSIYLAVQSSDPIRIIKLAILIVLATSVFILTLVKNKKAEVASLIGIALFVFINALPMQ